MKLLAALIPIILLTACSSADKEPLIIPINSEREGQPGPKVSKKQLEEILAKASEKN